MGVLLSSKMTVDCGCGFDVDVMEEEGGCSGG
jgi:hypothetical protein